MKTLAKPIEMVNWMDEEGVITPVRFRIRNEEGANTVARILRIHHRRKEMIAGSLTWSFQCEVSLNNQLLLAEIRFDIENCRWNLFKI